MRKCEDSYSKITRIHRAFRLLIAYFRALQCTNVCVALHRRPLSAASNSSLSDTAYSLVAGGHTDELATILRQWRLDRPPCLHVSYALSALLIFNLRHSDHVSDALASLHWLRVPDRIRSNVAVLVYKVLQSYAPSYLADLPSRRAEDFALPVATASFSLKFTAPLLATEYLR